MSESGKKDKKEKRNDTRDELLNLFALATEDSIRVIYYLLQKLARYNETVAPDVGYLLQDLEHLLVLHAKSNIVIPHSTEVH